MLCGVGRTGRWLASEHCDVVPDIVTLGRGLSGGTCSHYPVTAAAGLAAVGIIEHEGLVQLVTETGQFLGPLLSATLADYPHVAQVRGLGCLWSAEFAADKASLRLYPRAEQVTERLWQTLFGHGLITYKSIALAGLNGDALVIAPPFVAGDQELKYIADTLAQAVSQAFGG